MKTCPKSTKLKGMALVMTMAILSLLVLLFLTQMQIVLLFYQQQNKSFEQDNHFYELEMELNQLLTKPFIKKCTVKQNPLVLFRKNKTSSFCHLKRDFFYLIQNLGVYPCLQNKEKKATEHWRIFMFKQGLKKERIQIRFAKKYAFYSARCEKAPKRINEGILSWRYS